MDPKAKKRGFRACLPCRARKVRCIVTGSCQPCMNCKLDEKDCNFAKGGGAQRSPKYLTHRRSSATPESYSERSSTDHHHRSTHSPRGSDTSGTEYRSSHSQSCEKTASPTPISNRQGPLSLLYDPTDPNYAFLQAPKAQTILPQDLEFLHGQGCFAVPRRAVLDEFMHHYFSFIHPLLPVINEADFWALYDGTGELDVTESRERLSIIVLQGMLFSSCTFVSQDTIKALGFKTTQDAKYSFYRRAKLIYDLGYERSSVAIAQAAVLLSHSHLIPLPYGGYKQLGSLWLGIAIHHARDARAHQYAYQPLTQESAEDVKRRNVLKRLWMCCLICDRVIPLTSRQSITITRANFDFDASPMLAADDLADEDTRSNIYDAEAKVRLAQVSVKLVELCVVLTDVLTLSSSIRDNPSWGLSQRAAGTNDAAVCRVQLQRWYNGFLEMKAAMNSGEVVKESSDQGRGSSVVLFTNLAEMYYHSARLALCHYEMLYLGLAMSSSNPNFKMTDMLEKSYELQNANSQITECLAELTRLRLIRWLPMSAVGCTAFPLALQILDAELLQPNHHRSKPFFASHQQQRLNMLIDAMKTYRPRYYIVDWVARTIRHIVAIAHATQQPTSVASWLEILQRQPGCYLRLAMTMDLSISHGKLPEESDFPPGLRDVVRNSVSVTLSPTIVPLNFNQFRPLEPAAATNSEKDTTLSTDTDAKSTPGSGFPSEDALFDDSSTTFDFDAAGAISLSPNANASSAFADLGAWPDALFPFNPNSPLTAIQPGLIDFPMGGIVDSSLLQFDPSQWTDNQANGVNEVQNFQVDESFLEMLRETAGTNCRSNDERLLDQLGKAVNMS